MLERDHYFNVQQKRVVCRSEDFFCKPIGLLDLVVCMRFHSYLEWTNSQYLQTVLAHYLCTCLFFLPFFPEKVILQKCDI
jgi:hypothetical protein